LAWVPVERLGLALPLSLTRGNLLVRRPRHRRGWGPRDRAVAVSVPGICRTQGRPRSGNPERGKHKRSWRPGRPRPACGQSGGMSEANAPLPGIRAKPVDRVVSARTRADTDPLCCKGPLPPAQCSRCALNSSIRSGAATKTDAADPSAAVRLGLRATLTFRQRGGPTGHGPA